MLWCVALVMRFTSFPICSALAAGLLVARPLVAQELDSRGHVGGAGEEVASDVGAQRPAPDNAVEETEPGQWLFGLEGGLSILSNRSQLARAGAGAIFAGYRHDRAGLGLSSGFNFWRSPTRDLTDDSEGVGVWNLGIWGEWLFAQGYARTQLTAGLSVLVEETDIDPGAGTTGFYLDIRPIGLRWPMRVPGEVWSIGLDPLGLAIMIPDPSGIPLVEVQYMTHLRIEVLP